MSNLPGNSIHDESQKSALRHSALKLYQRIAGTYRFGELSPCFAMETVPGDKIVLNSFTNTKTYTLKSPLLSRLNIRKAFLQVPIDAVLPFQAERIVTNPTLGSDVPDDAYCYTTINKIASYFYCYVNMLTDLSDEIAAQEGEDYDSQYTYASALLSFLIQVEYFYSAGSLFSTFKQNLHKYFGHSNALYDQNFDALFDKIMLGDGSLKGLINTDDIICISNDPSHYAPSKSCIHRRAQWLRDNPTAYFKTDESSTTFKKADIAAYAAIIDHISFTTVTSVNDVVVGLGRCISYQLCCAHFFTNDKVDYIYSAELYRQYIHHLYFELMKDYGNTYEADMVITWNGINLKYDYLSGAYFNKMLDDIIMNGSFDACRACGNYFNALFGFRRSLKYQDYFTGSKTRPLAVGDTSVTVNDGSVSVVDITRNIQRQRFFNSVNRTGRKLSEYMLGIFGQAPGYDFHDPAWLAEYVDPVTSTQVENTGDSQMTSANSVTSRIESASGHKSLDFESRRFGWVIGIQYFDIPRMYTGLIERTTMHKNRFDLFNPQMQFVGDQPIYKSEITNGASVPFGYGVRYGEYKEAVDTCFGGFVKSLPSWIFKAPIVEDTDVVGPDFIRSRNDELDEFYVSLTGLSLGTYFHFIELHDNKVDARRPMVYQPQILG